MKIAIIITTAITFISILLGRSISFSISDQDRLMMKLLPDYAPRGLATIGCLIVTGVISFITTIILLMIYLL